jgi:hypothetical protein
MLGVELELQPEPELELIRLSYVPSLIYRGNISPSGKNIVINLEFELVSNNIIIFW